MNNHAGIVLLGYLNKTFKSTLKHQKYTLKLIAKGSRFQKLNYISVNWAAFIFIELGHPNLKALIKFFSQCQQWFDAFSGKKKVNNKKIPFNAFEIFFLSKNVPVLFISTWIQIIKRPET